MNMLKTLAVVGVVIVILAVTALFSVQESEKALVARFGALVTDGDDDNDVRAYQPGLHVKWPFISKVIAIDQRLQTLDIPDQQVITDEQKFVIVNLYVKWRVNDFARFYVSTTGDFLRAEQLLAQRANNSLRSHIGNVSLEEVIHTERKAVMQSVLDDVNQTVGNELGIDVVDVRIKRIELPEEVNESIYDRMRTAREEMAALYRAQGDATSEQIRAIADRDVAETIAKARSEGQRIRGLGDANAAQTYAEAYQQDEDFFAFYQSINAYQRSFSDKGDIIVLQPNGDFFNFFNAQSGQ